MNVHCLVFKSMPKLGFAHRYGTDVYNANLPPKPGLIEITYIHRGNICYEIEGEMGIIPSDSVMITVYDRKKHYFCSEAYHQHTTVGFFVDYEENSESGLVLPHCVSFKTPDNPIRSLLEQLVLQYNLNPDTPRCLAMLFELLGKVSDIYQTELQQEETFGKEWYVTRAKQYIIENIEKPPHITDTAKHLDISTGYLSHIFKEITGQTVTQFINIVRIRRIEELVLSYGMDIREAGEQVGLNDPNYVSRLFRRVRGCTLSELRHARYKYE
ncbi:MAG: helix-turn-helix transcriptional regulator [Ruminococcaceae bacterium]|nr:helix-turn-helix transcriptional regulator [Oscillospiraceae bacterium]